MTRNPVFYLLVAVLLGHFAWIAAYVVPAYASPDADGYFTQARLIVTSGRTTYEAASPLEHVGAHWLEYEEGKLISRYPPGLPVLLAGVWTVLGRSATFFVNPLLATLTLLFLFLLCRSYLDERLTLVAVVAFAVNPLANYHAVHSDAHTASTFFLVAGLWALDGWLRRGGWRRALAAGLLLGTVPTVRYAEAVAALGIVLILSLNWRRVRERPAQTAVLLCGALVPVALLAIRNQTYFGAFWQTGYALTNEQRITWEYFSRNWRSYVSALLGSGVGPFVAFGIAGFAGMATRRETRPIAIGLATIAAAITAVYAGYYFNLGPQGASMRFLLPTLPLYLLPAMWLFRQFRARQVAIAALGVLMAVHLAYSVAESREQMGRQHESASRSAAALAWVEENIPAGSVIVSDRMLHESINFTGKWKLAMLPSMVAAGERRMGPFGAAGDEETPRPMQADKLKHLRAAYEGLRPREAASLVLTDIETWAGGSPVYWIGQEGAVERFGSQTGAEFERVGDLKLPEVELARRRGPGGRPAGNLRRQMLARAASRRANRPPGGPGFGPAGEQEGPPGMGFPPMGMLLRGMVPGGGGPGFGPVGEYQVYRMAGR